MLLREISFKLNAGQSMAITGASGSGKTLLGRLLAGQLKPTSGALVIAAASRRHMVDQQDHFIAYSGRGSMHYGFRYESQEMDSVPSVKELLVKVQQKSAGEKDDDLLLKVMNEMEIRHLAERKILALSNGERKRTQLAMALLQQPDLLVLDQPFVGLDAHSRERLKSLLHQQMTQGLSLVLIIEPRDSFAGIDWVLELDGGQLAQFVRREHYSPQLEQPGLDVFNDEALLARLPRPEESFQHIVLMKQVKVIMHGEPILKNIDWQVKSGEQWALLGPNGAGKSTLLSLITADNPQAYNNHLHLFDRQRGSGETIWDIKKRIGFVSPELHLYFLKGQGIYNTIPGLSTSRGALGNSLTCEEVVLSGFRDEVGFTSAPTDYQQKTARGWLEALGLDHLAGRGFVHTSLGEQRLVLLVRALVKTPQLLILDEPCQGMDLQQTKRFLHLLDGICRRLKASLIYVTHRKEEIPSCVTHLLELNKGEVISQGEYRAN